MILITPDTEVLTTFGWKSIDQIDKNSEVAHIDVQTNAVSFIILRDIEEVNEEYLYSFNSRQNSLSFNVGRNTNLPIINNITGLSFKYAKDIIYSNSDSILTSGFKFDGRSNLSKLDKILILISTSSKVINIDKKYSIFGFTNIAKGIDTKIVSEAMAIGLDVKKNFYSDYIIELKINNKLLNGVDIYNLNWINLLDVNYKWIYEFITMMNDLTISPLVKKKNLQYRSNSKKEISKIQSLISIGGLACKLNFSLSGKTKYLLDIYNNPIKKCENIKKTLLYYNDCAYNIVIPNGMMLIIRHGYDVSVI